MPTNYLAVPISLDCLHLETPTMIAKPLADFSRLPYFNGRMDVNSDTAYLSEQIVSEPFENLNMTLPAGAHLHWSLPYPLTQGEKNEGQIEFPPAPNRWLIGRTVVEHDEFTEYWIVESDYLFPSDQVVDAWAVCYPFEHKPANQNDHPPPFRYTGRALRLQDWLSEQTTGRKYLSKLTAIGYGEPSFAAFYPNCFSIFGFADQQFPKNHPVTYTVWGWYANEKDDFCQSTRFKELIKPVKTDGSERKFKDSLKAFEEAFHWTLSKDDWQLPERLLCYGQATLNVPTHENQTKTQLAVDVALGNTGTEALAALLAHQVTNTHGERHKLEDAIEAINLLGEMEQHQIDIGAKFQEARHNKGFQPIKGGAIWTIKAVTESDSSLQKADPSQKKNSGKTTKKADASAAQPQVRLRPQVGHPLNQLNILQQQYDSLKFEIDSQRRRIFTDWYKYMSAAYPSEGGAYEQFDIDAIRSLIESEITELADMERKKGVITPADIASTLKKQPQESLAHQIAIQIQTIYNQLPEEQLIQADDIADWGAFIQEIGRKKEPVWHLLQNIIKTHKHKQSISNEGKRQIIDHLQSLGKQTNLHQQLGLSTKLPPEAASLAAKNERTKAENYRLNRLLLQIVFISITRQSDYTLSQIPGPRYWVPNEPVALLHGEGIQPNTRHDPTKTTSCMIAQLTNNIGAYSSAATLTGDLDTAFKQITQKNPLENVDQSGRPWQPLFLEWEVLLYPTGGERSNIDPAKRAYKPDFVEHFYQLEKNKIDLTPKVPDLTTPEFSTYTGRSILTPGAKITLVKNIDQYLEKHLLGDYFDAHNIENDKRTRTYFQDHKTTILAWYESLPAKAKWDSDNKKQFARDPFTDQMLKLHKTLSGKFHILAQALGGFNDALLGHKLTMQLPIADPLGFVDYQTFAKRVKKAVKTFNRTAPQATNDFNPIRSGHLQVTQLQLVDTFGQIKKLSFNQFTPTAELELPDNATQKIQLPVRLVQPARLNLRWLANHDTSQPISGKHADEVEMNSHPITTPICGWLVANNINKTILFYNQAGQALGYFDKFCHWHEAPGGRSQVTAVAEIKNPHLKQVAQWIEAKGVAIIEPFIKMIDSAQENINPANFAQHLELALLMSQPVAVVRANLSLQHRGLPAINQDGVAFNQSLQAGFRETDNMEQVTFPIRLGEHRQLNDGLIGYWKEQPHPQHAGETSISAAKLRSPQSEEVTSDAILTWHDVTGQGRKALNEYMSMADPAQTYVMLFDPRGKLHATTGILPTKAIDIPADQFKPALGQIEVSFLSTPILTENQPPTGNDPDAGEINLPLPLESGYQWLWSERESDGSWKNDRTIKHTNSDADHVGQQIIREGWLILRPHQED